MLLSGFNDFSYRAIINKNKIFFLYRLKLSISSYVNALHIKSMDYVVEFKLLKKMLAVSLCITHNELKSTPHTTGPPSKFLLLG